MMEIVVFATVPFNSYWIMNAVQKCIFVRYNQKQRYGFLLKTDFPNRI